MAILAAAATKIAAVVEYQTEEKEGQYGPYVSVLFLRYDFPKGDDAGKVWRALTPKEAERLPVGTQVNLIPTVNKQGRDSWDIEITHPSTATATTPAPPTATPITTPTPTPTPTQNTEIKGIPKKEIAQFVQEMGDLYVYCRQIAEAKLPDDTHPSQIQAMASTLFIACKETFF